MIMTEEEMDEQLEQYEVHHPEYVKSNKKEMKIVYSYGYYEVTDKKTVEMLLVFFEAIQHIKENCDNEFYSKFIVKQHDLLRLAIGLPNEVFCFYPNKDKTKIIIELYPLAASERHYKGLFDEEVGIPCILVDESE